MALVAAPATELAAEATAEVAAEGALEAERVNDVRRLEALEEAAPAAPVEEAVAEEDMLEEEEAVDPPAAPPDVELEESTAVSSIVSGKVELMG